MLPEELSFKVKELIAENKVEEAIKLLLDNRELASKSPELYDEILLISSDWKNYQLGVHQEVQSNENLQRQYNKLRRRLLEVLKGRVVVDTGDNIGKGVKVGESSGNTKKSLNWLWVALPVAAIALWVLFIRPGILMPNSANNSGQQERIAQVDKTIYRRYKIRTYDWPKTGDSRAWMLDIYEDYSGAMVSGEKRFKVSEFKMDEKLFLSFSLKVGKEELLFSGIVPLGKDKLEGGIIRNGEKIATWSGERARN
jgi:hypothetical protein